MVKLLETFEMENLRSFLKSNKTNECDFFFNLCREQSNHNSLMNPIHSSAVANLQKLFNK